MGLLVLNGKIKNSSYVIIETYIFLCINIVYQGKLHCYNITAICFEILLPMPISKIIQQNKPVCLRTLVSIYLFYLYIYASPIYKCKLPYYNTILLLMKAANWNVPIIEVRIHACIHDKYHSFLAVYVDNHRQKCSLIIKSNKSHENSLLNIYKIDVLENCGAGCMRGFLTQTLLNEETAIS